MRLYVIILYINHKGGRITDTMDAILLSNLVIEKVLSASTLYTSKNARRKGTDHSCWSLIIKYEGQTVYTFNGKQIVSDLNHLALLPKGSSYEWLCTKEGHCCMIEFDAPLSFEEPFSFPVKNGEKFLKMFKELEYKRSLKTPMVEMESIIDTYNIILSLVQAVSEPYAPSDKQQILMSAIEYISQNYSKNITNDTLADITGVSTVYFRKLFKQVTGVPPMTFVQNLRIEKAKEMLRSEWSTISDIAQSLGYSSLYDFSRDFKKHTGVAPSKYAAIK